MASSCTLMTNGLTHCSDRAQDPQLLHVSSRFRSQHDHASTFGVQLPAPVEGVVGLRIVGAEIPNTAPVTARDRRKLYFTEFSHADGEYTTFCATLPVGSLSLDELLAAIDVAMELAVPVSPPVPGVAPRNAYVCMRHAASGRVAIGTGGAPQQRAWTLHAGYSGYRAAASAEPANRVRVHQRLSAARDLSEQGVRHGAVVDDLSVVELTWSVYPTAAAEQRRLVAHAPGGRWRMRRVSAADDSLYDLLPLEQGGAAYAHLSDTAPGVHAVAGLSVALVHHEGNLAPALGFRAPRAGYANPVVGLRAVAFTPAPGAAADAHNREFTLLTEQPHHVDAAGDPSAVAHLAPPPEQPAAAPVRLESFGVHNSPFALSGTYHVPPGGVEPATGWTLVRGGPEYGGDLLVADDKFDPSAGRRVCYVDISLPGRGSIGRVVTNDPLRRTQQYFARIQTPHAADTIEFPMNDNLTGIHLFDEPVHLAEFDVRLLDEWGNVADLAGVEWSFLLEVMAPGSVPTPQMK